MSAAAVSAALTVPVAWLAHRSRVGPLRYDSDAQAIGVGAALGALTGLGWYYGIRRYVRDNAPDGIALTDTSAADFRQAHANTFLERPPDHAFACRSAHLGFWGVDSFGSLDEGGVGPPRMQLLGQWEGRSMPPALIGILERVLVIAYTRRFKLGVWAYGRSCDGQFGGYLVTP